jgi:hypothetical protein
MAQIDRHYYQQPGKSGLAEYYHINALLGHLVDLWIFTIHIVELTHIFCMASCRKASQLRLCRQSAGTARDDELSDRSLA